MQKEGTLCKKSTPCKEGTPCSLALAHARFWLQLPFRANLFLFLLQQCTFPFEEVQTLD